MRRQRPSWWLVALVVVLAGCGESTGPGPQRSTGREPMSNMSDMSHASGTATPAGSGPTTTSSAAACQGMAEMDQLSDADMASAAAYVSRRSADGRYERVHGETPPYIDPHVDTSVVAFGTPPTAAQRRAADAFVAGVRDSVSRHEWGDQSAASRSGFVPMQQCATHWVNRENVLDHRVLDVEKPEFLVYGYNADGSRRLDSVMFMADGPTAHGPQPFGSLAVWHYHEATPGSQGYCMLDGMVMKDTQTPDCPAGMGWYPRTAEMLHVMVASSTDPFGSRM